MPLPAPASADLSKPVYMARQPIYDRRMRVYAYEILYRRGDGNSAGLMNDADCADSLINTLIEFGLDQLVGNVPAFINIPEHLLDTPAVRLLPRDRTVLEILEHTEASPRMIEAARSLAKQGYKLALDDFVFGSAQEAFLGHCKVVKVDVMLNNVDQMYDKVKDLKKQGLRLLAEKVETIEVYNKCFAYGFDYFQGYFFAKPVIVSGRKIPQSKAVLFHLLTRLQDPHVTIVELEELVSADAALAHRLIKLVNSACEAVSDHVESVRSAIMLLGLDKVRALVSLLSLTGAGDKPSELLVTAMVRARMCEALAQHLDWPNSEQHFTVGLLSVLEALFDMPMQELMADLPLHQDVKAALLNSASTSNLSQSLQMSIAFEQGNWEAADQICPDATALLGSYLAAVNFTDHATQALAA